MMFALEDIMPRLHKIEGGLPVKRPSSRIRFGEHGSMFYNRGMDFHQIAEYDSDRHDVDQIAWELSDTDVAYVRERIEMKEFPLLIVADLSTSMLFAKDDFVRAKLLLEAVAALGFTAAHDQDPIGFLGFTDGVPLRIPEKSGRGHVYYIIQCVYDFLRAAYEEERSFGTDLTAALSSVRRWKPTPALCAVISDCIGVESDSVISVLRTMSAKHETIFLILDDPEEFSGIKSNLGTIRIKNAETGTKEVVKARAFRARRDEALRERRALREELRRLNIASRELCYGTHMEELTTFFAERRVA